MNVFFSGRFRNLKMVHPVPLFSSNQVSLQKPGTPIPQFFLHTWVLFCRLDIFIFPVVQNLVGFGDLYITVS